MDEKKFRAETAAKFMVAIMGPSWCITEKEKIAARAIEYADELIKQLKEGSK